jgi:hypothetical protein
MNTIFTDTILEIFITDDIYEKLLLKHMIFMTPEFMILDIMTLDMIPGFFAYHTKSCYAYVDAYMAIYNIAVV